jgi:hypothetical protein
MRFSAVLSVLFTSIIFPNVSQAQQSATSTPPHVLTCGRSFVVESQVSVNEGNAVLTPVWT